MSGTEEPASRIPSERQWAALETRRFVEFNRDWQAIHSFYARVASGTASLAEVGITPVAADPEGLRILEQQVSAQEAPTRDDQPGSGSKSHKDNSRRTTYRLDIAYLGSAFEGFAKDRNLYTICSTAEEALQPLSPSTKVNLVAAGRTDRGVSAAHQVLSFPTYDDPAPEALAAAINAAVPGVLTCLSASRVPRAFHATFSARWRRYAFLFPLRGGAAAAGVACPCVSHAKSSTMLLPGLEAMDSLDVEPEVVDRLLRSLEGVPLSYESFGRDTLKGKDLTCCLYRARARRVDLPPRGDADGGRPSPPALLVELIGNRFLRRMVRVLVATALREALELQRKDSEPGGYERLLRIAESRDRVSTPTSMPAIGLCFVEAGYGEAPEGPCFA